MRSLRGGEERRGERKQTLCAKAAEVALAAAEMEAMAARAVEHLEVNRGIGGSAAVASTSRACGRRGVTGGR